MSIHEFVGINSFNQPTQVTFPSSGTVSFTLIGGGGGGGGRDVHPGQNGANGERIDGQFRVNANTQIVFHIGAGGKPGASDANSSGGGVGGSGLIYGGNGGNPGVIGTSGGGGGGGAATFMMLKTEFDKLISGNNSFSFLAIAGGGGGGGGAGVSNGIDSGTTSALSNNIYGNNGQSNTQDGGGGGGGGGGLKGGGGGSANPTGYDTTGLRGRNGLSAISSGASSSGKVFNSNTTISSGNGGTGSRVTTSASTETSVRLTIISCSGPLTRGFGFGVKEFLLDFGNNTGTCGISYDFQSQDDEIEITHNGIVYTTGLKQDTGTLTFNRAPGTSRYAILHVNRKNIGSSSSYWEFNMICPSGAIDPKTDYPIPSAALSTTRTSSTTTVVPSESGTAGYVGILYTPDESNISNINVKINGLMQRISKVSFRNNKSWVDVKDAYVRVNGQWINIYSYVDLNSFIPTFTTLNVTEPLQFEPIPYPFPVISCTGTIRASGQNSASFILDFGSKFGTAGVSYDLYGARDVIEIVHNGVTYSTGPKTSTGTLTFNRAPGTSRYAVLYVNRNFNGSAWEFSIICPT